MKWIQMGRDSEEKKKGGEAEFLQAWEKKKKKNKIQRSSSKVYLP